jgi:hypothetical protein
VLTVWAYNITTILKVGKICGANITGILEVLLVIKIPVSFLKFKIL